MPELPEVETVARDLRGAVTGRRIEHVTVDRPDVVRYPDGAMLPALLTGQRFENVERRGKYLLPRARLRRRADGAPRHDRAPAGLRRGCTGREAHAHPRCAGRRARAPLRRRASVRPRRLRVARGTDPSASAAATRGRTAVRRVLAGAARRGAAHDHADASRRRCSIRRALRASATSTSTRRASWRASGRRSGAIGSPASNERRCSMRSVACSARRSPIGAAASTTIAMCGTRAAATRSASRCTDAAGSRASSAGAPLSHTHHRRTHHRVLREMPAMTRVTIASYDDDPPLGGQGVVVHGMRAALERRGVRVHTISGRGEHAIAFARRTGRAPLDFSHAAQPVSADPAARRAGRDPRAGWPRRRAALEDARRPLVYTAHHTYRQAHARGSVKRMLNGVEARSYRGAAMVLPVSRSTANALLEMRHSGVAHRGRCSNGVDAVDLPGVEHEDGRVLFVSRMEREKGALDAISVLQCAHRGESAGAGGHRRGRQPRGGGRAGGRSSGGRIEYLGSARSRRR